MSRKNVDRRGRREEEGRHPGRAVRWPLPDIQMLPDKEVTVSVSADGFEGASRKLSLPEGKTEEVTFVLEPKAPKGAGR